MQRSTSRQVLSLDPGWKFHLGDISSPLSNRHIAAYMANKAGWARGAAKPQFDDSDWADVDLPHDWSIEGTFDPDNHVDSGFLPRGIGWYRRYFYLDESDRNRHLSLQFDGVATHCTVFVNGHLLHRNFCGYTPFSIDMTDVAVFGDEQPNCLAVRVDATYVEGWWYEGAGIYRHVWITKTSPVHIASGGVFVRPVRIDPQNWNTSVDVTIENASDVPKEVVVLGALVRSEAEAGRAQATAQIAARSQATVSLSIPIHEPALWSCDSPSLYLLRCEVRCGQDVVDEVATTFGYRTVRFDSAEGFFLNDVPMKLLGTCNHQDHGGLGVAVPDSIHEFRIRRLLEMGTNACRCAHNPPAAEFLDACDRLGMLVINEARNFGTSSDHLRQLKSMVVRDRNHPSVIVWSICNEEAIQGTPVGASIARSMQAEVKKLDPSRSVSAAISGGLLNDDCIASVIEVVGINYQLPLHDAFHARRPATPLLALETHSNLATRGVHVTSAERFYFASDDSETASWGAAARQTWRFIRARPFIAGMFIWTGFDYRGEPTPHAWPCVNSHFGLLDLCGFAKDSFYLHKAWFTRSPFVHLMPHWNWPEGNGKPIKVRAYSNCQEVELFLNDQQLGRRKVDPIDMAAWDVIYEPGKLHAIGYVDNKPVASCNTETTAAPVNLGLEIPGAFAMREIPADGAFSIPVSIFATDDAGRRIPTADVAVQLQIEGPGRILGVANGDPTSHLPAKASSCKLFNGLAQVIVQTMTAPGEIVLRAGSSGLQDAELKLHSTPSAAPVLQAARARHLVRGWRMSPPSSSRPNPHDAPLEQDMNTWQRVEPGQTAQVNFSGNIAYVVFHATATAPRRIQSEGGELLFHEIAGQAEVLINGRPAATKSETAAASLSVSFAPSSTELVVTVLVTNHDGLGGITRPVEIASLHRSP
jgi:beta-galactosidase